MNIPEACELSDSEIIGFDYFGDGAVFDVWADVGERRYVVEEIAVRTGHVVAHFLVTLVL